MRKPVVGIVSKPRDLDSRFNYMLTSDDLKRSIFKSGGLPIGLLPLDLKYGLEPFRTNIYEMEVEEIEQIENLLNLVDGVVLQGGLVINSYELKIAELCLKLNKPILGICCGFDIMLMATAATGHELIFKRSDFHWKMDLDVAHEIFLNKETLFHSILQVEKLQVNSIHKSVILPHEVSVDWRVGAVCLYDGSVEAIEFKNHKFAVGVKFHPELMCDELVDKIFCQFVLSCIMS